MSNSCLEFVTNKIKDADLSSFHFHNANVPQYLSNGGLDALEKLSKNDNLVVQRVDKDNSVVLVNRNICVIHMDNILKNQINPQFILKEQILSMLGEVSLET